MLWGDGSPTREFLYAEDAADGIIAATQRYETSEAVNLGNGCEIKISDLAAMIQRLWGYEGRIVWDESKPNGQPRRCLDVSRARERFGFEAKVSLEQGLQLTIAWYQENRARIVSQG